MDETSPNLVALFPCMLRERSFIIYDIYSPKRDSKRLTWHYCLSLLYTKRARESFFGNAAFYLRQIFSGCECDGDVSVLAPFRVSFLRQFFAFFPQFFSQFFAFFSVSFSRFFRGFRCFFASVFLGFFRGFVIFFAVFRGYFLVSFSQVFCRPGPMLCF
jgi:hypothetical protein